MTFSVLMYAMMGSALASLGCALVVEAVRGPLEEQRSMRVAQSAQRYGRGRSECRETPQRSAEGARRRCIATPSRSRRRALSRSCDG